MAFGDNLNLRPPGSVRPGPNVSQMFPGVMWGGLQGPQGQQGQPGQPGQPPWMLGTQWGYQAPPSQQGQPGQPGQPPWMLGTQWGYQAPPSQLGQPGLNPGVPQSSPFTGVPFQSGMADFQRSLGGYYAQQAQQAQAPAAAPPQAQAPQAMQSLPVQPIQQGQQGMLPYPYPQFYNQQVPQGDFGPEAFVRARGALQDQGLMQRAGQGMQDAVGQIGTLLQGNASRLTASRQDENRFNLTKRALDNQSRQMELNHEARMAQTQAMWGGGGQQPPPMPLGPTATALGTRPGRATPQEIAAFQQGPAQMPAQGPAQGPAGAAAALMPAPGRQMSLQSNFNIPQPPPGMGQAQDFGAKRFFDASMANSASAMDFEGGFSGGDLTDAEGGSAGSFTMPTPPWAGGSMGSVDLPPMTRAGQIWNPQFAADAQQRLGLPGAQTPPQAAQAGGAAAGGLSSLFDDFSRSLAQKSFSRLRRSGTRAEAENTLQGRMSASRLRNQLFDLMSRMYGSNLNYEAQNAALPGRMLQMLV